MNPNNTTLFRKQGQSQVVDAQGNLQSFGGNLDTLPIYKPQNNVITPDTLTPTTKIDLSGIYPKQPTGDGLVAGASDSTKAFDTEAAYQKELELQKLTKPDSTELDTYLSGLLGAEQGLTGKGAAQSAAEISAGIPEAQKLRSSIQGQLKQQLAEYNAMKAERDQIIADIEAGAGRKGLTTGAVMGQVGAQERQYLARLNSKAAEIGILQAQDEALKGDIETAQKTVDRAVDLKYQDREAEYTAWKNAYDRVKGNFDAEEKKRGEALAAAKKKEEEALKEKKEEEKKANEYLFTAIQGKAPQSLVAKAQDLINKGAKANEVAKILGQYSMSEADRLDLEIKKLEKSKLNKEINNIGVKSDKLLSVTEAQAVGVPYGTTEGQLIAMGGQQKAPQTDFNFLKQTTQKAYDLASASGRGTLRKGVGSFLFGATESKQLEGLTETLRVNVLTMSTDPNIKKFFGPQMTENDVRMMTGAGTTLSPDTQTPEQYAEEATRIYDMINRAQTAVEEGLKREKLSNYIDSTSTALQVVNSPFIQ